MVREAPVTDQGQLQVGHAGCESTHRLQQNILTFPGDQTPYAHHQTALDAQLVPRRGTILRCRGRESTQI